MCSEIVSTLQTAKVINNCKKSKNIAKKSIMQICIMLFFEE